jgi:hypothetical protein
MTVEHDIRRPTLGNSCAMAASAHEASFRIQRPFPANRATRIVALDQRAAGIVSRLAERGWSEGAHFLTFEGPLAANGHPATDGDATLRAVDGTESRLSVELDDADVAVMVATADDGADAASMVSRAAWSRGVMTAGLVVADGGAADQAVSALRPHAAVLVVTADEDDVPEMLTALRA